MDVDVDARATVESLRKLQHLLDHEIGAAFDRIVRQGARYAREHHGYTRRTGTLEDNTVPIAPLGAWADDTLTAAVMADTEYAKYVEARPEFAFMEPMSRAMEPIALSTCEHATAYAIQQAGL